jgi:nucleotide-binding universal stress UspA family protein
MNRHRVLIPVDGSDFSRQIFAHVIKFLPSQDNKLILLRVGDPPEGYIGHPPRIVAPESGVEMYETARDAEEAAHPIYESQERESAEAAFRVEMQADIRALAEAGYVVESQVRFGEPGEAIVEFVLNHQIELVAMTTHWRRGIDRLIFGSVAQYVAQRLSIPVLMVRADEPA